MSTASETNQPSNGSSENNQDYVAATDLEEGTSGTAPESSTGVSSSAADSSSLFQDLVGSKVLQDGQVPPTVMQQQSTESSVAAANHQPVVPTTFNNRAVSTQHFLPVATIPATVTSRRKAPPQDATQHEEPVYSAKPVPDENDCLVDRRRLVIIVVILVAVIVIVVTTSVVMIGKRNEPTASSINNANWWTNNNDTTLYRVANSLPAYTTQALQADVASASRAASMTKWFETTRWSNSNFVPASPQGKAWQRLVLDSKTTVSLRDASLEAYSEEELTTRFALGVLYFSTDGYNWANATSWLSSDDLCLWFSSTNLNTNNYPNDRVLNYSDYVDYCRDTGYLSELRLGANNLKGTLPLEIALLTKLTTLSLNYNALTGPIPTTFNQLTRLRTFDCYECNLQANFTNMMERWSKSMQQLVNLRLPRNQLRGTFPLAMTKFTRLNDIRLYDNQLSGSIADELWSMEQVAHWKINGNQMTGTIPTILGRMTNLRSLRLDENLMHGSIPNQIGGATSLREFGLKYNEFSGSIPTTLGLLTNFEYVYWGVNKLVSTVPTEIGKLTNMIYLEIEQQTRLYGTIPTEIAKLTKATDFSLAINQITGTLPTELAMWNQSMIAYYFHENLLTGTIPTELGALTVVGEFNIGGNGLSGEIPTEMGTLRDCYFMDLSSNLLSGTIPSQFSNLGGNAPIEIFVQFNDLTGSVPLSVCQALTPFVEGMQLQIDCQDVECACNCTCG
ncbi:hypothetical protein MPSEU_001035900 [Mayamaea pseudoterrestris]|nr:hypothetical protein MPSEU_001035900 [Mayamaea pseudoterrestris]